MRFSDSIHFKIALFVIVTVLISFGSYSGYLLVSHAETISKIEMESTELLGHALNSSLEIAMLNSDLVAIQHSLEEASRHENIEKIFLLDENMEVKASSDTSQIGQTRSQSDPGCRECHGQGADEELSLAVELEERELLRVVIPIVNKPQCFACHDSHKLLNGLLVLDRSVRQSREALYASIVRAVSVAAITVLVMMLLFRWFIKRQIINRVAYLESLARRVVGNELDLEIHLSGRDELSSLARSFDNMKRSLRISMEEIEGIKEHLNNLLNNLGEGILVIDKHDRIVFVNQSFSSTLEIAPLIPGTGIALEELFSGRQSLSQIETLLRSTRRSTMPVQDLVDLPMADGRQKNLEVRTGYLTLPPRKDPEVMVVIRDITDIINYEKQAYQSDKLATIGRLAAGVAHEINNPMASIMTCAEGLLRSQPDADSATREYLEIIRNSARRCKMITQKLLEHSAVSEMKKEIVNPVVIIEDAIALLQFEASNKSVSITLQCEENVPPIVGSRDALMQVFVNLTLNSIQAADSAGRVDIDVRTDDRSLIVTVTDNGEGISPDNAARVFEPFFTTKAVGIGTGLGLSVSMGIIRQHRGTIEIVSSRPGLTVIRVSLPLVSEDLQNEE